MTVGSASSSREHRPRRTRASARARADSAACVHTSAPAESPEEDLCDRHRRSASLRPRPLVTASLSHAEPGLLRRRRAAELHEGRAGAARAARRSTPKSSRCSSTPGSTTTRTMSDVFLAELDLPTPDVFLGVGSGSHGEQTARALVGVEQVLLEHEPVARRRRRRRQLDAGRRARGREAPDSGRPHRGRAAELRPDDAGGAQPPAHRPPERRPPRPLAERRRQPRAPRGSTGARAPRRQHDDRLAARARRDGARRGEPGKRSDSTPGGYGLVTLHRPALVDDPALLARDGRRARRARRDGPARLPGAPANGRAARRGGPRRDRSSARASSLTAAARLPRLPRARGRGAVRAHRLRRRPGGDVRARRPVLHAARHDRAAGHGRARDEHAARSEPGADRRHSRRCSSARKPARPIPLWDGHAGERAADVLAAVPRRRAGSGVLTMCGIAGTLSFDPAAVPRRRSRTSRGCATRSRTAAPTAPAPGSPTTAGSASASAGSRSSTSPTRRCSRWRTRTARSSSSSTARSTTTPRSGRSSSGSGHRFRTDHSDTEVIVHALRGVGHRLPPPLPRHVRVRALGRAGRASSGSCATASGSSRSTGSVHHGRLAFALRDQGAAPGSAAGARGRRGVALPLPVVPHDAGAADALPRHPQARRRDVAARRRGRRRTRGALLGRVGRASSRSTACPRTRSRSACSTSCATSVQLRKVSDVPVGVFLSGGIDSSTNAALFSEGETRPVKTFSIGYDGDYATYPNELDYARRMARRASAPSITSGA